MDVAGIVTELIAGGVGGNIAGAVLKSTTSVLSETL